MIASNFVEDFYNNINNLRNEEFKKYNLSYEERIIEKKPVNENLQELKKYKHTIKKNLLDKNNGVEILKKELQTLNNPPDINNIDILEDDIFHNNSNDSLLDEDKLDISILDRENKLKLIHEFLQRKNINLEEQELIKIESIVDDPNIVLKKYFNISKMYQQITRISFIKKLENGSYIINLNENKPKKSKKYFNN
jgi:hypothetical protein